MPKAWTLDDGISLVRAIQQGCRKYGYHVTIGGGVVNKGTSDKDVDLYFHPLDNGKSSDLSGLMEWLTSMWGEYEPIGSEYEGPASFDTETSFFSSDPLTTIQQTVYAIPLKRLDTYRIKAKFIRTGGDRIDAFII